MKKWIFIKDWRFFRKSSTKLIHEVAKTKVIHSNKKFVNSIVKNRDPLIKRIDKRFQNLLYNEPAVSMKADIAKRNDSEAEESEESESDTQEKDECDW